MIKSRHKGANMEQFKITWNIIKILGGITWIVMIIAMRVVPIDEANEFWGRHKVLKTVIGIAVICGFVGFLQYIMHI